MNTFRGFPKRLLHIFVVLGVGTLELGEGKDSLVKTFTVEVFEASIRKQHFVVGLAASCPFQRVLLLNLLLLY
jgi:hypothetical protein